MPSPTDRPELLGRVTLTPQGRFTVRQFATFTLTYTAGRFGVDDTGGIKVILRFPSDSGPLQTDDGAAPNYVSAEASGGATLQLRYDRWGHVRPWGHSLFVRVLDGCLTEGDTIVVRIGDTAGGGPGYKLQTFCQWRFEFRVLVDPVATRDYVLLPECPSIAVVPGPPERWKAVLPTLSPVGETFRLSLKAEDAWGNPTDRAHGRMTLESDIPISGFPDSVQFEPGSFAVVLDDLRVEEPGTVRIRLRNEAGEVVAESNPMVAAAETPTLAFWGDLHGQSGETVGANTARDYFTFARDRAFLDVTSHQGNDFQITPEFWAHLNDLTAEFDEPGRFVAFPGYEWSGNTPLGGDRNVFFRHEGRTIRRSSHALVDDRSDVATDCNTAAELFRSLEGEDAVVYAHVGGRYADLSAAHDPRMETAVEIHSAWGTFQWLLHEAFDLGYRVGVVCNSDDHKGRPGASYPGGAVFGSYGGLTCFLAPELSRDAIFECLRRRRHYGTTGARLVLHTRVRIGDTGEAQMGDIVRVEPGAAVALAASVIGSAPIERVDFLNGREVMATARPYGMGDVGRRIRLVWEGAAHRGRERRVDWTGGLSLTADGIRRFQPFNSWNPERRIEQSGANKLSWTAATTGNMAGVDVWLEDGWEGDLVIHTPHVKATLPLAHIGFEDTVLDAGGVGRRMRLFRLPEENPHRELTAECRVPLESGRDNPLYVRVVQEDGHMAWSSPVYLFT